MKLTEAACTSIRNLVTGRLRFFDLADAQVLGASKRVAYYWLSS